MACAPASASRFKPRKALPEGWDATVEFGAQATSGASRTSSFSGGAKATYRDDRWEHKLVVKVLHSSSSVLVERRDEAGEPVIDARGKPLKDLVRNRTNDRRFIELGPRWYFRAQRNYVFAIVGLETNEPAGIERSTRQVAGVGYRLLTDKSNWFTAGVGFGNKSLSRVSGVREEGNIAYVGLSFTRPIGERAKFETTLDSDFGSENRSTELTLGFTWKVGDPISLKVGYEARMNSDLGNPSDPFDESVDARASVTLEIDVL